MKNLKHPWELSNAEKVLYSQKRFEIVLQNGSFRNCSLKVLLGTKNGSSMASLQKHPFGTFIFKIVK